MSCVAVTTEDRAQAHQKLYVTWDEYQSLERKLAKKIRSDNWDCSHIVCIARGGMLVGDALGRLLEKPLAVIFASSYSGSEEMERGSLTISEDVAMTAKTLSGRVLLVDDLCDSGKTLETVRKNLKEKFPEIDEIRSATLWVKTCSQFEPDYYVNKVDSNVWIVQPFENMDG